VNRTPSFESLIARIRGEYREMPGLHLTLAQACRLWQVDATTCETVLEQLVREAFLHRTDHGAYIGLSTTAHHPAKAHLRERFGASVAEVDHHELWQRSRLAVACASSGHRELVEHLNAVERYLGSQAFELVRVERDVVVPGEL